MSGVVITMACCVVWTRLFVSGFVATDRFVVQTQHRASEAAPVSFHRWKYGQTATEPGPTRRAVLSRWMICPPVGSDTKGRFKSLDLLSTSWFGHEGSFLVAGSFVHQLFPVGVVR